MADWAEVFIAVARQTRPTPRRSTGTVQRNIHYCVKDQNIQLYRRYRWRTIEIDTSRTQWDAKKRLTPYDLWAFCKDRM